MTECKFDSDRECKFDEVPDDPDVCQACLSARTYKIMAKSREITNLGALARMVPYEEKELRDALEKRIRKTVEEY